MVNGLIILSHSFHLSPKDLFLLSGNISATDPATTKQKTVFKSNKTPVQNPTARNHIHQAELPRKQAEVIITKTPSTETLPSLTPRPSPSERRSSSKHSSLSATPPLPRSRASLTIDAQSTPKTTSTTPALDDASPESPERSRETINANGGEETWLAHTGAPLSTKAPGGQGKNRGKNSNESGATGKKRAVDATVGRKSNKGGVANGSKASGLQLNGSTKRAGSSTTAPTRCRLTQSCVCVIA